MSEEKKEKKSTKPKAEYRKPEIKSEKITSIAALCNGTATPPRKSVTTPPDNCGPSFLKS